MKAKFFFTLVAATLFAACTKDSGKSITITPSHIDAPCDGAYVNLRVEADGAITFDNQASQWVTVEEGVRAGEYTVDIAPNEGAAAKEGIVIFKAAGAPDATLSITQKGTGIIADWDLLALKDESEKTFTLKDVTTPGFNGCYAAPSEGKGKIEYYCCEKASFFVNGKNLYAVGSKGDLYVNGTIEGDYWQITADSDVELPAGTKVQVSFMTNFGDRCTKYWMLEYKDGSEFKPVFEVKKVTESAVRGLNTGKDTPISYSKEIEYNFEAGNRSGVNSSVCKYEKVVGEFTLATATKSVVVKFGPSGHVTLMGPAWEGKPDCFIDKISGTGGSGQLYHVTRLSSQDARENGDPAGTYNQHITVKVI